MSDTKPTYSIVRCHEDVELDGKTGKRVTVILKSADGENQETQEYFIANDQVEATVLSAAAWAYEDGLNFAENGFVEAPQEVAAMDKEDLPA